MHEPLLLIYDSPARASLLQQILHDLCFELGAFSVPLDRPHDLDRVCLVCVLVLITHQNTLESATKSAIAKVTNNFIFI